MTWKEAESPGLPVLRYEINGSVPACTSRLGAHNVNTDASCTETLFSYPENRFIADLKYYPRATNVSFRIRAVNWKGPGDWSDPVLFSTRPAVLPPKPAKPQQSFPEGVYTDTSISIAWTTPWFCDDMDWADIQSCQVEESSSYTVPIDCMNFTVTLSPQFSCGPTQTPLGSSPSIQQAHIIMQGMPTHGIT